MRGWFFFLLALLRPYTALATATRELPIVLVRSSFASRELSETLNLARGELIADGFQVKEVAFDSLVTRESLVRLAEATPEALAIVSISFGEPSTASELWVVDRLGERPMVTRVELAELGGDGAAPLSPEVIARRTVEVLRATLLPRRETREAVTPAPAPATVAKTQRPVARHLERSTWSGSAGASVLSSWAGPAPAILPTACVRWSPTPKLALRAVASGWGTRPVVERSIGAVSIEQLLVLSEIAYTVAPLGPVYPSFDVGLGAYRAVAAAQAKPPYQPSTDSQWALLASVGGGATFVYHQHWRADLELRALFAAPYPSVRFVGHEVARLVRPGLLATLTLGAWL